MVRGGRLRKWTNWLEQISTLAVVFKFALVQLHANIGCLKIQGHHLATSIPENLFKKIREFNEHMEERHAWGRKLLLSTRAPFGYMRLNWRLL
jgi:hypothetical protein